MFTIYTDLLVVFIFFYICLFAPSKKNIQTMIDEQTKQLKEEIEKLKKQ
jgi:hypothetical protein